MLIRKPSDIRPSEITSETNYVNRRQFLQSTAAAGGSLLAGSAMGAVVPENPLAKLSDIVTSEYSTTEEPNRLDDIATYNNYYEFGTAKDDPYNNSQDFKPRPWSLCFPPVCWCVSTVMISSIPVGPGPMSSSATGFVEPTKRIYCCTTSRN